MEFTRLAKGLSQQELGDMRSVRIAQYAISDYERGASLPVPDQRRRLADALGLDPDRLLDPVVPAETAST
jgi:transcriptional regulator with XRE-family HTH domain